MSDVIEQTIREYRKRQPRKKVYHHTVLQPKRKDNEMKVKEAQILVTAKKAMEGGLEPPDAAKVIQMSCGLKVDKETLCEALQRNKMWDESWDSEPFERERKEWEHEDVNIDSILSE